MIKTKNINWRKITLDFLSIFVAVIAAFALNNWNENRRDTITANKILAEISNGLEKDIEDVRINKGGHEDGILACKFWRKVIDNKAINLDTLPQHYFNLTRDYVAIQNISGYESLKSRGLELIKNDSLRFQIITLYEYDYNTLKKFEEEYIEMQYQQSYFEPINQLIAPKFKFDDKGNIIGLNLPLNFSTEEKNLLLSYLWKIQVNRAFILRLYPQIEEKIIKLKAAIQKELKDN